MTGPLRFGVTMTHLGDRDSWVRRCRRAEDLGYDVITVPDHLDMPAPFPACVVAAEVTTNIRVGTYVSNTAFYHPALLMRDVATTSQLTGGRFEPGLGAGWARRDFDAAGIAFEEAPLRVDRLAAALTEFESTMKDAAWRPPLLVGGNGDRVLKLAARHADIISFSGTAFDPAGRGMAYLTAAEMAGRVAVVEAELKRHGRTGGQRNLNVLRTQVTDARESTLAAYVEFLRGTMTPDEVAQAPGVLIGSVREIANQVRKREEAYGLNYITVQESALEAFAPVIDLLSQ